MIRCIQYERMTIKIFRHHENSNVETATKDMLNNIRQIDLDTKKPKFQRASGVRRRQVYEELDKSKPTSRLRAVDPKLLLPVVSKGASHTQVVNKLKGVIETTMIRRSASSNLPKPKGSLRPCGLYSRRFTAAPQRSRGDQTMSMSISYSIVWPI